MDKRTFLKSTAALGLAGLAPFESLSNWVEQHKNHSAIELAEDENFWEDIRKGYLLKPDYINLENGYYCFLPQETLDNYINHIRELAVIGPGQFGHLTGDTLLTKISHMDK